MSTMYIPEDMPSIKTDEPISPSEALLTSDTRMPVKRRRKFNRFLRILGPGLITGAADDDPSGIATYTQTGAQFGYGQLWTVPFLLPLMMAVQEACGRIGAVSGKGIAAVVRDNYSKKILYPIVLLVLLANTINIGADIGAMAEALQLITPIPFVIGMLLFVVIILLLEVFVTYSLYVKFLKWLALAMLSYVATVLIINVPWQQAILATFTPHFELSFGFLFLITGVLGTTISPYMFFWQASGTVEEERANHMIARDGHVRLTPTFMKNLRIDTFIGMGVGAITMWSIIVVAGTVLNAHGITNVSTAADAAKALEPLVSSFPHAGYVAKLIFSLGIIGLGLLAVPVLSGSAAYAVSESVNWKAGLGYKLKRAHGFYGVITIATLIGLLINFVGINPVKALVFTAVFNGVASVPLLFLIAKIAQSKHIMGDHTSGWLSRSLVWLTFAAMTAAAVAMLVTLWLQ